jgi:hypothetical protein
MTWHYRASVRIEGGAEIYEVREYFDLPDGPSWTEDAIEPSGESMEALARQLEQMLADVKTYPVLDLTNE